MHEHFAKGDDIGIRKKRDSQSGKILFVVEAFPETDPFRWGLFVGDVVQNLRSALDHLAFALADKDSPSRGENRVTQFVVARTDAEFSSMARHLRYLSQRHLKMIREEQAREFGWAQGDSGAVANQSIALSMQIRVAVTVAVKWKLPSVADRHLVAASSSDYQMLVPAHGIEP